MLTYCFILTYNTIISCTFIHIATASIGCILVTSSQSIIKNITIDQRTFITIHTTTTNFLTSIS